MPAGRVESDDPRLIRPEDIGAVPDASEASLEPLTARVDDLVGHEPATELASNRTSLAVERTRMAADRTLMAIVRTALSLIGFGYTIYQAFHQLQKSGLLPLREQAPRNFGLGLVLLGILMLVMGIASHAVFGGQINRRRQRLFSLGLLRRDIHYHATPTFIVAVLLLLIGLAAAVGIIFRLGIFE
jgi:putative membrane protein